MLAMQVTLSANNEIIIKTHVVSYKKGIFHCRALTHKLIKVLMQPEISGIKANCKWAQTKHKRAARMDRHS